MLVLASKSASRQALLRAAGVAFEVLSANVDEEAIKDSMLGEGMMPRDMADALAEAKALKVSLRVPGALVLGSDQILETASGSILSKAENPDQAIEQLLALSGQTHTLWSAAVICENGNAVWRNIGKARMAMRTLSPQFVENYVENEWENIRYNVGCYAIEGVGAQLFVQVNGTQPVIMGMPLLPVLDYLRVRKVLSS